jgi:adenosylmethionine-8-amino-7-oxononanoate aminotransferase
MPDTPSHPNSPEARDAASVIHPLTNLQAHLEKGALVIEEGDGVWVTDNHGNRYIEGMSGLWCLSLGYGQQRLVDAAAAQMAKLPYYHLTNHKSHGPVIDLAEKLLDHPLVGEVRGKGLLAGVELVKDRDTGEAFDAADGVGPFCAARAEHHGLILRAIGDTIAFCPPLIIDRAEIGEMIARFRLALDDTLAKVREKDHERA